MGMECPRCKGEDGTVQVQEALVGWGWTAERRRVRARRCVLATGVSARARRRISVRGTWGRTGAEVLRARRGACDGFAGATRHACGAFTYATRGVRGRGVSVRRAWGRTSAVVLHARGVCACRTGWRTRRACARRAQVRGARVPEESRGVRQVCVHHDGDEHGGRERACVTSVRAAGVGARGARRAGVRAAVSHARQACVRRAWVHEGCDGRGCARSVRAGRVCLHESACDGDGRGV
ncbi:hypothetical protein K438DRAFT_1810176 [Mycena galopus ATCC 62051]|nr:hypothetical protein K438DRAFT_1810176 [Mycena galopus ATCC 62051]